MWGKTKTPETDKLLRVLGNMKPLNKEEEEVLFFSNMIIQYYGRDKVEYCIIESRKASQKLREWGIER